MHSTLFDVAIVGAGAAGLMAAYEISLTGKTVVVIEAHNRTGGRIHTIKDPLFPKPVELGPEFIHGRLPITLELLKKAGIKKVLSSGEAWQQDENKLVKQKEFTTDYKEVLEKMKALKQDIPVAEFIQHYLAGANYKEDSESLKSYVQGYYAGDIEKASTYALYEELTTGEEENFRIDGGYQQVVAYLEKCCREKGVLFYLEEEVQKVQLQDEHVLTVTSKQMIAARKLLVTVSIGVLQQEAIVFPAALAPKLALIKKLGFGHVIKINLSFTDAFWQNKTYANGKNLRKLNFLFSQQVIPTWWTQYPEDDATLTGWLGGPPAMNMQTLLEQDVTNLAIQVLSSLFSIKEAELQKKLKGVAWYNWSADRYFSGAYSYNVVNGEQIIAEILKPLDNRLYFAGEGLQYGNEIGTVEAAFTSGRNISHQLIAEFAS